MCPELVARYLESGLPGDWYAVILEFGIRIDSISPSTPDEDSMWENFAKGLEIRDVVPELRTSLTYFDVDGRHLFIELYRRRDLTGQRLLCLGRVARPLSDIDEDGGDDNGHKALGIVLDRWNDDMNEIVDIGSRLAAKIFGTGGL